MKLFRFKSNQKTIVHYISDTQVQIVWSSSFERWGFNAWIYRADPDNLIPLTEAECHEIVDKRKSRALSTEIGRYEETGSTPA